MPVNMWIIDHPKGLLLFDTGNNAAISDGKCKTHWAAGLCDFLQPTQKRDDVIDRQLQKLGYKVDDVKIVSGDVIWVEENLEGYPAGLNYSILDYTKSLNRLKMMRDIENAKLWLGHSMKQYESMGTKWYK